MKEAIQSMTESVWELWSKHDIEYWSWLIMNDSMWNKLFVFWGGRTFICCQSFEMISEDGAPSAVMLSVWIYSDQKTCSLMFWPTAGLMAIMSTCNIMSYVSLCRCGLCLLPVADYLVSAPHLAGQTTSKMNKSFLTMYYMRLVKSLFSARARELIIRCNDISCDWMFQEDCMFQELLNLFDSMTYFRGVQSNRRICVSKY